jgi:hypothetical protein
MNLVATRHPVDDKLPETAIASLSGAELRETISLLRRLLEDPDSSRELDLLSCLHERGNSTAYKSVMLHVNRCMRELRANDSPAFHAPVVRVLKHVLERLLAAAEASAGSAADPLPETRTASPRMTIEDGIRMVYETTVWRTPGASEVATWKQNLDN